MGKKLTQIDKILSFVKTNNIKFIDMKFMDFPGKWQHFTIPANQLNKDNVDDGIGFDGSSIRGWKNINDSDMLIIPDANTMFVDTFIEAPTISLICDVYEPATKERYSRCPRNIVLKATEYLKSPCFSYPAFFCP